MSIEVTCPACGAAYNLNDQLEGVVQNDAGGGARVVLSDVRDPALQVTITISNPQATDVTVSVSHGAQSLCSTSASPSTGPATTPTR